MAKAKKHFAFADELESARELARAIEESQEAGAIETEPNNTVFELNIVPLDQWVEGNIETADDVDYFVAVSRFSGSQDGLYQIKISPAKA